MDSSARNSAGNCKFLNAEIGRILHLDRRSGTRSTLSGCTLHKRHLVVVKTHRGCSSAIGPVDDEALAPIKSGGARTRPDIELPDGRIGDCNWALARLRERAQLLAAKEPEHYLLPAFRYKHTQEKQNISCVGYDVNRHMNGLRTAWRSLTKVKQPRTEPMPALLCCKSNLISQQNLETENHKRTLKRPWR